MQRPCTILATAPTKPGFFTHGHHQELYKKKVLGSISFPAGVALLEISSVFVFQKVDFMLPVIPF
jgi:hypothetical protein